LEVLRDSATAPPRHIAGYIALTIQLALADLEIGAERWAEACCHLDESDGLVAEFGGYLANRTSDVLIRRALIAARRGDLAEARRRLDQTAAVVTAAGAAEPPPTAVRLIAEVTRLLVG
jgi:hypothetical protein